MSAQGQVRSVKHGSIGEVEAGKGSITRYADGRPTRFTFKTKFDRAPHLQVTPIFIDPKAAFKNFWIYHLAPSGDQAVDESGFYLGCCGETGLTIHFEYLATAVYTAGDEALKEPKGKRRRRCVAETSPSSCFDTDQEEDVGDVSYFKVKAGFPSPAGATFLTNEESHEAAKNLSKPKTRRAPGPAGVNCFIPSKKKRKY
ncbi:hypothetical protein BFJ71_g185 [Fusarium oxysporum]|nr:hypothetical protein BFJ71_g185 [Fusarium oxysporum]